MNIINLYAILQSKSFFTKKIMILFKEIIWFYIGVWEDEMWPSNTPLYFAIWPKKSFFSAEEIGVKELLPAYLDPSIQDADLPTGVSFASGGSGYDPQTPQLVVHTPFLNFTFSSSIFFPDLILFLFTYIEFTGEFSRSCRYRTNWNHSKNTSESLNELSEMRWPTT